MSVLHKFRFEPMDELGRGKVTIDDKPIKCRGFELKHYVKEVPSVNIEVVFVPQIEENATVKISNKEEIAALMDEKEFNEFFKIWERVHRTRIQTEKLIRLDAGISYTEALKRFGIDITQTNCEDLKNEQLQHNHFPIQRRRKMH